MRITLQEKISLVDDVLNSTNNRKAYRYYKDILTHINKMKRDNDSLFKANIQLMNKLNRMVGQDEDN